MGVTINARKFSSQNQAGILKPIIYCCLNETIEENAVSMNQNLAQVLKNVEVKRRTMQVERCFIELLAKLPEDAVVKEFDVLFNPAYKIDVLKILVNACKIKTFSVLWPGTFEGNKLIYAKEGCKDYKIYDVKDYDITCIV